MTVALRRTPFPLRYRELWLSETIRAAQMPAFRGDAHGITLTSAQKGTTADGLHFDGSANANVDCGALHNGAAKLWVRLRFKLDRDYAAGGGDKYLWAKQADATHYLYCYLATADGKVHFSHNEGAGELLNISVGTGRLKGGVWYDVLASISNANGARLLLDNGVAAASADVTAAPAGGNIVIGDQTVGGGVGIMGLIADVVVGSATDLTAAQEAALYTGFPKSDSTEIYWLDEGAGATATNRGTSGAGANAAIGTACTWSFGQVKHALLSPTAISGNGLSAVGVNISGEFSFVEVLKAKSTYLAAPVPQGFPVLASIKAVVTERFVLAYNPGAGLYSFVQYGGGFYHITAVFNPAIDDYMILIYTFKSGQQQFFINGTLFGSTAGVGQILSAAAVTCSLTAEQGPTNFEVSKPLFVALLEGALTPRQALTYSRWLRDMYNLPISM